MIISARMNTPSVQADSPQTLSDWNAAKKRPSMKHSLLMNWIRERTAGFSMQPLFVGCLCGITFAMPLNAAYGVDVDGYVGYGSHRFTQTDIDLNVSEEDREEPDTSSATFIDFGVGFQPFETGEHLPITLHAGARSVSESDELHARDMTWGGIKYGDLAFGGLGVTVFSESIDNLWGTEESGYSLDFLSVKPGSADFLGGIGFDMSFIMGELDFGTNSSECENQDFDGIRTSVTFPFQLHDHFGAYLKMGTEYLFYDELKCGGEVIWDKQNQFLAWTSLGFDFHTYERE